MPKTKLSDVLKNSENFNPTPIDVTDPDFIAMLNAIKEEKAEAKERSVHNRAVLDKIFIK